MYSWGKKKLTTLVDFDPSTAPVLRAHRDGPITSTSGWKKKQTTLRIPPKRHVQLKRKVFTQFGTVWIKITVCHNLPLLQPFASCP